MICSDAHLHRFKMRFENFHCYKFGFFCDVLAVWTILFFQYYSIEASAFRMFPKPTRKELIVIQLFTMTDLGSPHSRSIHVFKQLRGLTRK